MSFSPVRLNRKEIGRILKQDYAEQVNELANKIADEARSLVDDDAVSVDEYTTDRAAASVSVPAELQATLGVLTKAAAKVGLEVQSK
jgi:hypothetical protein